MLSALEKVIITTTYQFNFKMELGFQIPDARHRASGIISKIQELKPDLLVFAYGTHQKVRVLLGSKQFLKFNSFRYERTNGFHLYQGYMREDPWVKIHRFLDEAKGHFVGGYLGYDLHGFFSSQLVSDFPSSYLFVPEVVLEIFSDSIKTLSGNMRQLLIPSLEWGDYFTKNSSSIQSLSLDTVNSRCAENKYKNNVNHVLRWINQEEHRRFTLARRVLVNVPIDFSKSLAKGDKHPLARAFFFAHEGYKLVGTSPELLIAGTVHKFKVYKLAGTTAHKKSEALQAMLSDPKIVREHESSISVVRKNLQGIGKVSVGNKTALSFEKISHMMSALTVKCDLGIELVDILRASLPTGIHPVQEGFHLLEKLEPVNRGPYYGLIGLVEPKGGIEFSQVLRTAFYHKKNCYSWVGAAITASSNPADEYLETKLKLSSIILAADGL